jgi:hypothetical protein
MSAFGQKQPSLSDPRFEQSRSKNAKRVASLPDSLRAKEFTADANPARTMELPLFQKARMHEVRTEIDISATPARIWEVLTDFPAHAQWNPFVRSIEGQALKGDHLLVTIQPLGSKSMTFKPRVLVADADKELRWLGHFLVRGVFDGEHYFQMTPNV